jgi:hypothetical protein
MRSHQASTGRARVSQHPLPPVSARPLSRLLLRLARSFLGLLRLFEPFQLILELPFLPRPEHLDAAGLGFRVWGLEAPLSFRIMGTLILRTFGPAVRKRCPLYHTLQNDHITNHQSPITIPVGEEDLYAYVYQKP